MAHDHLPSAVYTPIGAGSEVQTLYAYDGQHRLTNMTTRRCTISSGHSCSSTTALGSSTYAYDANHNRTSVTESRDGAAAPTRNDCYDPRNQLVARNTGAACSATTGDETYTYDAAGNRLTATQGGATRTFTYTADGQLAGALHDAAGRLTEFGDWRAMAFDAEGRLTEVCEAVCSTGSTRFFFTYDADGRRTKIVESSGGTRTTTELRYEDGRISAEYVDGTLTREYVTDHTGAVVKMRIPSGQANAGTYLVAWNGHGDALNLLAVGSGAVTLANSFSYDTWGAATVYTHNGYPDLAFRFRYVGQHGVQDETVFGIPLLLMGGRHFAPELARFVQPDPAATEANLYAYTANNPTTRADPSGMCWGILSWIPVWTPWGLVWKAVCVSWWWSIGSGAVGAGTYAVRNLDNVNLAQNKRQAEKRIRSLEGQIGRHNEKIRNCKNCPEVRHWRGEISTWQREIARLKNRWGIR